MCRNLTEFEAYVFVAFMMIALHIYMLEAGFFGEGNDKVLHVCRTSANFLIVSVVLETVE